MTHGDAKSNEQFLPKKEFDRLLFTLGRHGFTVIGPTIDQGAIVYGQIESADDLPRGWTDEQAAGHYRLKRRSDDAWFGYVVGPHSWKQFLFPPQVTLSEASKTQSGWQFRTTEDQPPKYAMLGVRACELAALRVQDRVFLSGPYIDPIYQGRRIESLVIAVNCTQAAATCFCESMRTGPRCHSGFDLALTELPDGFTIEVASDKGAMIIADLKLDGAALDQLQAAQAARRQAVDQMDKRMDTTDIRDLLLSNLEHPQWDDVASRCLSCTNCTMVCPTCFCSSVEDVSDLSGEAVERRRNWDSCFNMDLSYLNGGSIRADIRARYRQWLTHKLATWIDQFGTSGCVGCGRCITWCPAAIDLTEEVAAIRGDVP